MALAPYYHHLSNRLYVYVCVGKAFGMGHVCEMPSISRHCADRVPNKVRW